MYLGFDSGVEPIVSVSLAFSFFFLSYFIFWLFSPSSVSFSHFHSFRFVQFIFHFSLIFIASHIFFASARASGLRAVPGTWSFGVIFFVCIFSFSDDPGDYDQDGAGLYR